MTSRSGGRSSICAIYFAGTSAGVCGGQPRGQRQRRHQARRIGLAGAGDVEGGAVIGRGAHERQAERHVHRVVEGQRLDRDQRLVVIHAERDVVARARPLVEQRVGRQRPDGVDALRPQLLDRRRHDGAVLLAERAFFAGMRIEPGDRDARARDAEARGEIARDDAPGLDNEFAW